MENLIYFYILNNPTTSARKIYSFWRKSKIFREYEPPQPEILSNVVKEIKQELIDKGIRLKLN